MALQRARSITLPGVIAGFPAPAVHNLTGIEAQIAKLPGLIHYLNPADIVGRNQVAYDRAGGAPIAFHRATTAKLADGGAAWNNMPVIQTTADGDHVLMSPNSMPKSYTLMMVASTAAILGAAGQNGRVFAAQYGVQQADEAHQGPNANGGLSSVLRWQYSDADYGTGLLMFSRFGGIGTSNTAAATTNIQQGGTNPYIWMYSFDAETTTGKVYGHGGSLLPIAQKTNLTYYDSAAPGAHWSFMGSPYTTTQTMVGKLGSVLIFDRAMDKDGSGLTGYFAQANALLKEMYNIT